MELGDLDATVDEAHKAADIARDFANQLGAATVLTVERTHGFGLVQDQLLAGGVRAEGRRHVSGRQHRLGARTMDVTSTHRIPPSWSK